MLPRMYLPKLFEVTERAPLIGLVRAHPFATVVGVVDGVPEIAHLPLLVEADGERVTLAGHVARANRLRALVDAGAELTAIFHGPHAYVSPRAYATAPQVPTWNYAVVHARGPARLIHDPERVLAHLDALARTFESGREHPWTIAADARDLAAELVPAIGAFELEVRELVGKFKLSQNRAPEDWASVVAGFSASARPAEREVAALMVERGHPRG